jgi:hypothetical protein
LQKLLPQETHLLPKPSVVRIAHLEASLPVMDVLPNNVYASEAFLPMSFCAADFATNYVPFVDVTDAREVFNSEVRRFRENGD